MKNLKTKDYLGKARLVAAQDHNGTNVDPRRQLVAANLAMDNRNGLNSYAALNLFKPGLSSRSRQHSEPPIHRFKFPPTPPPEIDRPASSYSKRRSTESASSVPSGFHQARPTAQKPAKLDLGIAAFEQTVPEKPRLGTVRSASERPPLDRNRSSADRMYDRQHHRRSFLEDQYRTQEHMMHELIDREKTSAQTAQLQPTVYHQQNRSSHNGYRRPISIEEEEDEDTLTYNRHTQEAEGEERDAEDLSSTSSQSHHDSPLAFEIIPRHRPGTSSSSSSSTDRHRSRSRANQSRRPEVRKIRVKLYAEDTRYMMIAPDVAFQDLMDQVRNKLRLEGRFKLKMRDEEGDMVTMGDQDDLEMAVEACKKCARKERADMGKMDVSGFFSSSFPFFSVVMTSVGLT